MQKQLLSTTLVGLGLFSALSLTLVQAETKQTTAAPATPQPAPAAATALPPQSAQPQVVPAAQPVAAATTSPATLEGQVTTTTAATELKAADILDVSRQDTDTAGHSQKKYRAVSITLKNKQSDHHIEIVQAEISNALDETTIAQQEQQASQRKKAFASGLMRVASAATSFVPYAGYASYAGYAALAGTTSALNQASYAVQSMPDGGLQISNQFVKKVNNVVVSPNQTFTFKVMVPAGTDPQMKVIFKDLESGRILEI
jgi:hypothetical protein